MRRAINVINNQRGYSLPQQKPYIKTVCGFILFGHAARHFKSSRVPSFIASRFVFIFPHFKKNYRCCHPLTCTTACSHGKCKRGPAFEVRLSLPVRGGQVTKQMFTVFLEMICSLLSVDSGPAITSVTLIECWVKVGRRGRNGWTRWWCYTVNVELYAHKFHGNFMKVMILTGERICP